MTWKTCRMAIRILAEAAGVCGLELIPIAIVLAAIPAAIFCYVRWPAPTFAVLFVVIYLLYRLRHPR